jgi:hypothetical protein
MHVNSIEDVALAQHNQSVALLSQYMASAFASAGSADSGIHAADPGTATSLQNFLAPPQHT